MTNPQSGAVEAMARPVKTFRIIVRGSPAGARMQCWRAYQSCYPRCSFKEFLSMHTLHRVVNPAGVGERISATYVTLTELRKRNKANE